MIVVVATTLGILSVKLRGGRLMRLAQLELSHIWVIWTAIIVQTLIFQIRLPILSETVVEIVHLGTYAASFAFLWLNRHIPGALLIAAGAGSNAVAIFANGGVMPASASAWQKAGLPVATEGQFENSNIAQDAHLAFLGDIFHIPRAWPLSNVFSIGDVVIVIGGTYFAHVWCRRSATGRAGRRSVLRSPLSVVRSVRRWSEQFRESGETHLETATVDDVGLAEMHEHEITIGEHDDELPLVAVAGEAAREGRPQPEMASVAESGIGVVRGTGAGVVTPTRREDALTCAERGDAIV